MILIRQSTRHSVALFIAVDECLRVANPSRTLKSDCKRMEFYNPITEHWTNVEGIATPSPTLYFKEYMSTADTSCIFDPCVVPYYELVIRDPNYKGVIRIPFNLESWKRKQDNITANRGLPHADTTANSSLQCHD